ncbi:Molybdopterin or thiamine biosynthesis adenylyltransferase [Kaistia soli DSM 19436]|uniref:Molybdopterin-synthase adenylyltransferase n=1 Tax=Kaistia soli DSM 19436 TaxID=1122133 RepID=A0A1M5IYZ0_9HYPH|nr:molybdopterin-synthase adenylyltransferase MoeB [Kaistia soli]SHG33547.1 Molybdopterin or thiamine biosynthesis adenylyltransferase [Kaistia soli DSM 19436]
MSFTPDEIERYARHLVLPEVGGPGQQRLKAARVLVIGAGGLGSPVIQYLAAAGIGTIGVVDDDVVSLSNLQRQVLHDETSIGTAKAASAAAAVARLNPHVAVEIHPVRLAVDNADALIEAFDIVVDGSDNFETRFLVADRAAALRRPVVTAAVGRFDGSLTVLKPFEETDGRPNPGYRDLFPKPPPEGLVPSCAEAGILGAVVGILGTLQTAEVLKLVLGIGEPLVGRLLLVDVLLMRFETISYRRRS